MLYLILARSGGGKTTHITNLISDFSASENQKMALIVPEQFSFMSEKMMLGKVGAKAMSNIDVLSFTSLGEKLVGRPAFHERRKLDDASKSVLMRMALDAVKDKLQLYGGHTSKPSVISEFIALSSEFKQNSVSSDSVRMILAGMEDGLLKMKLNDIINVLDAYDSIISGSYFDPDDLLTELCGVLPESDYFSDRIVFIDGFRGFTAREYDVIDFMMKKATAVYITLCTDDLNNANDETDLFAHTKRTAMRLIESAKKNGVSVAKPQYLSLGSKFNNFPPEFERFASPELAALEKELFSPAPNIYEDECRNITLVKASDIYAECEYIACMAKKLIRENGFRCRDIAVIARDSSAYEAPLRSALKKCGVSVFEDSRQPIDASPVTTLACSILEIAAKGFQTETIMRCLKTELTGVTAEEISDIENYCYLWQINGSDWLHEWEHNPSGFGVFSDEDKENLEYLNSVRRKAISPLCDFKKSLEDSDGEKAAHSLYKCLERMNASENLRILALSLVDAGETGIVIELERMWNLLMELLDSFETLYRGRTVTASSFFETFSLMLSVQTSGNLPQGLDEITIGSADRIRVSAPKAVFIAGANSGIFPAVPFSGSALTDKDRRKISSLGIELSDFGEYKLAEEKLIAYNAFCCASHKLFVCSPERNNKGENLSPSELYLKIKALFPKCNEVDASGLGGIFYVESKASAFELSASDRLSAEGASAEKYLSEDEEWADKLASLDRAAKNKAFAIENENAAKTLFGKNINISASKIETYHKCAFSYFCRYGLKAMPRKPAELDPMQKGNVIHHVLEKLLSEYSHKNLSEMDSDNLLEIISAYMEEYLNEFLDASGRSERFIYLYNRLALTIRDVAGRLIREFSRSDFRPVDFELKIGSDGEVAPYELNSSDGKIIISGAIDRVDAAEINGRKFLRIVDYKSSGKDFRLSDVTQGLNMQMFVYLFTLWQNGKEKYGDFTPAGVLYYPANSPLIAVERTDSAETIADAKQKKTKMDGIVLDNFTVVEAMDKEISGLFIPVKLDKNGNISGSLISLKQLEKLREKADKVLIRMADSLHQGIIDASPVHGANYEKVCEYCDYKAVCGYEDNKPKRTLFDDKLKDVLAALSEGDEADEMD